METKDEGPQVCANCGRAIGKLETPNLYREHVVCAECAARLRGQEGRKTEGRGLGMGLSRRRRRDDTSGTLRRMERNQRFWMRAILYTLAAAAIIAILSAVRQHNIDNVLGR